jgi:hypothetical protein
VVANEAAAAIGKGKKIPAIRFCVVKTLICGHHLIMLLLFLEWLECFVFSGKLRLYSDHPTVTVSVLFTLFCFCFRYCRHGQPVSSQFRSSGEVRRVSGEGFFFFFS